MRDLRDILAIYGEQLHADQLKTWVAPYASLRGRQAEDGMALPDMLGGVSCGAAARGLLLDTGVTTASRRACAPRTCLHRAGARVSGRHRTCAPPASPALGTRRRAELGVFGRHRTCPRPYTRATSPWDGCSNVASHASLRHGHPLRHTHRCVTRIAASRASAASHASVRHSIRCVTRIS